MIKGLITAAVMSAASLMPVNASEQLDASMRYRTWLNDEPLMQNELTCAKMAGYAFGKAQAGGNYLSKPSFKVHFVSYYSQTHDNCVVRVVATNEKNVIVFDVLADPATFNDESTRLYGLYDSKKGVCFNHGPRGRENCDGQQNMNVSFFVDYLMVEKSKK